MALVILGYELSETVVAGLASLYAADEAYHVGKDIVDTATSTYHDAKKAYNDIHTFFSPKPTALPSC